MSSLSLSNSPGTFKVDKNVAGTFLEIGEWTKILPTFTAAFIFFNQHQAQKSTQIGFYIIPLCLGQGPKGDFKGLSHWQIFQSTLMCFVDTSDVRYRYQNTRYFDTTQDRDDIKSNSSIERFDSKYNHTQ